MCCGVLMINRSNFFQAKTKLGGTKSPYMRAATLIAALTLTVNSGVYNATAAQAPTVITDRVQCRECRIKHSLVATIGRSNDTDLLADAPVIAHSAGSLFLAVGSIPRVKVLVYDSTGRQVTAWGRLGSGPGEFRGIRSVRRFGGDSGCWNRDRGGRPF